MPDFFARRFLRQRGQSLHPWERAGANLNWRQRRGRERSRAQPQTKTPPESAPAAPFDLKMLGLRGSGILPVKLCPQSTEI